MREERAEEITPVRALNHGLHPSLDRPDARRTATARARLARVESFREIADSIANERHAEVVEVGDDDLSHFTGLRWPIVLEHLDDIGLRDGVVTCVRLALISYAREFSAAVLVEDL